MKKAVLVIDMIYDFVYGKLGSKDAQEMVPNLENFLKSARKNKIPIIYLKDSHKKSDSEMDVWGEHAMEGTKGSEIIPQLSPKEDEIVIPKNTYNGFFNTNLDETLQKNKIDITILTGVSTDICVQNTAAAASYRKYNIQVLDDCTAAIDEKNHKYALNYMKNIFGAEILNSKDLMDKWKQNG